MFPRDEDKQRELMYKEQLRTNELLERLVNLLSPREIEELDRQEEIEFPEETKITVDEPVNTKETNKNTRGKMK